LPSRSAWKALVSSTFMPQMGSLHWILVSLMARFLCLVFISKGVALPALRSQPRRADYFLAFLEIKTTIRTTASAPNTVQSHIPWPGHPPIQPPVWSIIKIPAFRRYLSRQLHMLKSFQKEDQLRLGAECATGRTGDAAILKDSALPWLSHLVGDAVSVGASKVPIF